RQTRQAKIRRSRSSALQPPLNGTPDPGWQGSKIRFRELHSGLKDAADIVAIEQDLARQDRCVLEHAAEDQTAFDKRRCHVGERIEIGRVLWRVVRCDDIEPCPEAATPQLE